MLISPLPEGEYNKQVSPFAVLADSIEASF
jgi:hypothetical protein